MKNKHELRNVYVSTKPGAVQSAAAGTRSATRRSALPARTGKYSQLGTRIGHPPLN